MDETSDDRTECWAGKGSDGEDGHGDSTGLGVPDIGNHTARVGQWTGAKRAGKETEDENAGRVFGQRTTDVPL